MISSIVPSPPMPVSAAALLTHRSAMIALCDRTPSLMSSRRVALLFGSASLVSTACTKPAANAFDAEATADLAFDAITASDVAYAVAEIVACRVAVRTVLNLVRSQDWQDSAPLMRKPPISTFQRRADTVANGPSSLNAEQRALIKQKAVPIGEALDALAESIEREDVAQSKIDAKAAAAALDEVLAQLSSVGLV